MSDPAGASWYVVHTQPNAERKAAEHITRQGYVTYLPLYLRKRRHAGRVETVSAPFFPRYLFVAIDVERQRWRSINSTVGVSRIVGSGDKIEPVSACVVDAIRAREDAAGYVGVASPLSRLLPGAPVRVAAGPFENCNGLFEALTDRDRVAILLDLLGRRARVELDSHVVLAV